MSGKEVEITVRVDNSFVSLLRAALTMQGYLSPGGPEKEVDVKSALAIAVLGEAMGQFPADIRQHIPPMWRPHLDVVHENRKVYQDGKLIFSEPRQREAPPKGQSTGEGGVER